MKSNVKVTPIVGESIERNIRARNEDVGKREPRNFLEARFTEWIPIQRSTPQNMDVKIIQLGEQSGS